MLQDHQLRAPTASVARLIDLSTTKAAGIALRRPSTAMSEETARRDVQDARLDMLIVSKRLEIPTQAT